MFDKGYCVKLADFYIRWADDLERAEDYQKTLEVFRQAKKFAAQPVDKIDAAKRQFEERMALRLLQKQGDDDDNHEEETRMFLGGLKGVGRKMEAPVVRASTGPAKGLSGQRSAPSLQTDGNKRPGGFNVFEDKRGEARMSMVPTPGGSRGSLPTKETVKENVRDAGAWNKAQVSGMKRYSSATTGVSSDGATAFDVYQDAGEQQAAASRRQTTSGDPHALQTRKSEFYHPLAAFTTTSSSGKQAEIPQYDKSKVNSGTTEYSFEELRALKFVPKPRAPSRSSFVEPEPVRFVAPTPDMQPPSRRQESRSMMSNSGREEMEQRDEGSFVRSAPFQERAAPQAAAPSEEAVRFAQPAEISRSKGLKTREPLVPREPMVTREPMATRDSMASREPMVTRESMATRESLAPREPMVPRESMTTREPMTTRESLVPREPMMSRESFSLREPSPIISTQSSASSGRSSAAGSPPQAQAGNTSFTRLITKEVMAVFSDTLHMSPLSLPNSGDGNDFEDDYKMRTDPPPSDLGASRPFEVYTDPPPKPFEVFIDQPQIMADSDKENMYVNNEAIACLTLRSMIGLPVDEWEDWVGWQCSGVGKPVGFIAPPKREKSGVLSPAKDIPTEPQEKEECVEQMDTHDSFARPVEPAKKKAFNFEPSQPTSMSDDITMFDVNEPTLARFQVKAATARISSTPYSGSAAPLTFSAPRWDEPDPIESFHDDFQFKPLADNLPQMDELIIPPPQPTSAEAQSNPPPAPSSTSTALGCERRLSAIPETSHEFRSGGSSLFSSSSNGSTVNKRTPGVATPNMPAIAESSYTQSKELESAVRRLSLSGEERTGVGIKIDITSGINPWNAQLQSEILAHVKVPPNCHHFRERKMPVLKSNTTVALGGETFKVDAIIGEGAFAQVYRCLAVEDGQLWVIKAQKPACPWEFYICEELSKRLPPEIAPGVMAVRDAFIYEDGSLLINEYHELGTLLDLNNKYQTKSKEFEECLTVYFTIQLIKILEATHHAELIHGDVKPDNFLVTDGIVPTTNMAELIEGDVKSVKLIDWGRAIDMKHLRGQTFTGRAGTSSFECCEMVDGRPWTYQTDLYGLLGTVHVMLIGKYMNVFKELGRYRITANIKRRYNRDLWKEFFDTLLNVPSCDKLPRLVDFRRRFEQFFASILTGPEKGEWLLAARQFNEILTSS
uniref:Uncharacterized protein n=1 Tax=Plectus sambesii TaxID=2011161 RepID=A0A914UR37_9BILA